MIKYLLICILALLVNQSQSYSLPDDTLKMNLEMVITDSVRIDAQKNICCYDSRCLMVCTLKARISIFQSNSIIVKEIDYNANSPINAATNFTYLLFSTCMRVKIELIGNSPLSDLRLLISKFETDCILLLPEEKITLKLRSSEGIEIIEMNTALRIFCPQDYYGYFCSVYCQKSEKYTCNNSTGQRLCAPTYGGSDCETLLHGCSPNPCMNEGNCSISFSSYSCTCQSGFTGPTCTERFCNSTTCIHGKCNISTSICECNEGYIGIYCDTIECSPNYCDNHGSCTIKNSITKCDCFPQWNGTRCEVPVMCESVCQHGGTCSIAKGGCLCELGYYGKGCSIPYCSPEHCGKGNKCTIKDQSVVCECQAGLNGLRCQFSLPQALTTEETFAFMYFLASALGLFVIVIVFASTVIIRKRAGERMKSGSSTSRSKETYGDIKTSVGVYDVYNPYGDYGNYGDYGDYGGYGYYGNYGIQENQEYDKAPKENFE